MGYITNNNPNKKIDLLTNVATMYYINGLTQREIAEQLGVGRTTIVRFLNEAKDLGIVTITVKTPADAYRNLQLEKQLGRLYNLKDCMVVNENGPGILENITPKYLNTIIPQSGIMGIGGGMTIDTLGRNMWLCEPRPNLTVVQLTGSMSNLPETSVVKLWSDALHCKGMYINAPLLANDTISRNILMNDIVVKSACQAIEKADTCIVSIGVNHVNAENRFRYLSCYENIDSDYIRHNSVGDIAFHFFNTNGTFIDEGIADRLIGVTIEQYLKIPTKIVVAYGENKVDAISTALKYGFVDILVTDSATAEQIYNR